MKLGKAWIGVVAVAVAVPAWSAQPMGCLIEPERVAEVGSPVVGVVETMLVERGDRVTKGQVVAVLRAEVERAAVSVAQSRADAGADVQAATANRDFTRLRLVRAEDLANKKFISQQALEQARAEADVAEQKLAQAQEMRKVSQRELALAATQLSQRTIKSPIDGVIAERYLSPGERIEEKPLLRVAKVDPLKVQVVVPTAFYGRIQGGSTAMVMPELPNAAPVQARVILVDKVIDAASNTFRVQLELPNPDLAVPAGLRCKVDFGLEPPGAAPTAGTRAPAASAQPAALRSDAIVAGAKPGTTGVPRRTD